MSATQKKSFGIHRGNRGATAVEDVHPIVDEFLEVAMVRALKYVAVRKRDFDEWSS